MVRREAHVSTEQSSPEEDPRFPDPHEDSAGPCYFGSPSPQGSQTAQRLGEALMRHVSPPGERLCRHHRLHNRAEFSRCYRFGRKKHGSLASVHFHPNDRQDVRLGITASRKVGCAAVRHRLKRRVREVFRRFEGRDGMEPMDVVVHLKVAASSASFRSLADELERLLASLKPARRLGA